MAFELSGKLIEKFDTQQVSEKFKKREFVVEKEENNGGMVFTEIIKFQLVQDKCGLLDPFALHDELKVSFNIKGSRWEKEGRVSYFTNLDAWRIEKIGAEGTGSAASTGDTPFPSEEPSFASDSDDSDDLPF